MSRSGSKSRGPGGGKRDAVGERRRRRTAAALGIDPEDKRHLDLMQERSMERFGVGVGVLVHESERLNREALSHRTARERIGGRRKLAGVLAWPWSHWHQLRRMEREAQDRADEWSRRLEMVALEVAASVAPADLRSVTRGSGEQ